jgi:hypothetical protein
MRLWLCAVLVGLACQARHASVPPADATVVAPPPAPAPVAATPAHDAAADARPIAKKKRAEVIKPPKRGRKLPCGATICDSEGNCTAASPPNCY